MAVVVASSFKYCSFFALVFIVSFYEVEAIPKFETSKTAILNRVPVWLTPLTSNDQNLQLALMLLNCSFTVRNISQCGSNFVKEAMNILTPPQTTKIASAASKYLVAVVSTASSHIELLCNIIYDGVKVPIWDKTQTLANKYKKMANYQIYAANMLNKAFNQKLVCNIAANVKTQLGAKAWQAAKTNFGDVAIMIGKCSL